MRKKMFLSFVVCALGMFQSACTTKEAEPKTAPIKVQTEVLVPDECVYSKNYVGIIEEQSRVSMSFTGSGMLARVYAEEGQWVRKGDLIAEIDKTQAENMLVAAKAQMAQADDAYSRLKQLHDNNSLPEMEWVEIQTKHEQAKVQLDVATKSLADCAIYAPVSGVIGQKVMNRGETVLPSMTVATILVVDKVNVRVSVPEKEISSISSDTPTRIVVDVLGGHEFEGGLIEKCIDGHSMTHTYDIKINLDNARRTLLPGMVAKVSIPQNQRGMALSVPITAVQKNTQGNYFVWTVGNGKATRTPVEIGESFGNRICITDGLKQGDCVVVEGYQKLSEGREVVQ